MFAKILTIYLGFTNIFNNIEFINNFNKLNNTYTLEENKFINDTYINETNINKDMFFNIDESVLHPVTLINQVPNSVDWRKDNIVSSVKNQEKCGSCWSFSAAGAVESAWAQKNNKLYNLSEQELMDCSSYYGNHGCNGGSMNLAFKYIINNGICTNLSYPYMAAQNMCYNTTCNKVVNISNYWNIISSERQLEKAVAIRPVSVAIEADKRSFQLYQSGVYNDINCGQQLDHGVLLVGYGEDDNIGMKYWIVKNSWGEDWGENGYIKIQKDSGVDGGICGIALHASIPVV